VSNKTEEIEPATVKVWQCTNNAREKM